MPKRTTGKKNRSTSGTRTGGSSRTRGAGSSGGKSDREKRREALLKRQREAKKKQFGGPGFFKRDLQGVNFWKCGEGPHLIDVIPYYCGDNDPDWDAGELVYGLYVKEHRNVGGVEGQNFICLDATYNKPCPICKHRRRLEYDGADEGLIKSLRPSAYHRSIYNIICYDGNEEDKGIQVWHTSTYLFENQLQALLETSPRGRRGGTQKEIVWADADEGKSIRFTREGKGLNTRFIGHSFLDRDYTISDEILAQCHVLDELIHVPTYEEVELAYWGEEGPPDSEGEDRPNEGLPTSGRNRPSTDDDGGDDNGDDGDDDGGEEDGGMDFDEIRNDLEDMGIKELRNYLNDEDIQIETRLTVKNKEKCIDEAIAFLEERQQSESDGEEGNGDDGDDGDGGEDNVCPDPNGTFGQDTGELEACDNCDLWDDCADALDQSQGND